MPRVALCGWMSARWLCCDGFRTCARAWICVIFPPSLFIERQFHFVPGVPGSAAARHGGPGAPHAPGQGAGPGPDRCS